MKLNDELKKQIEYHLGIDGDYNPTITFGEGWIFISNNHRCKIMEIISKNEIYFDELLEKDTKQIEDILTKAKILYHQDKIDKLTNKLHKKNENTY